MLATIPPQPYRSIAANATAPESTAPKPVFLEAAFPVTCTGVEDPVVVTFDPVVPEPEPAPAATNSALASPICTVAPQGAAGAATQPPR